MERKYWYQKQLRMVQTVLREPDIVNYDAKGVVKFLKDMNANSIICIKHCFAIWETPLSISSSGLL